MRALLFGFLTLILSVMPAASPGRAAEGRASLQVTGARSDFIFCQVTMQAWDRRLHADVELDLSIHPEKPGSNLRITVTGQNNGRSIVPEGFRILVDGRAVYDWSRVERGLVNLETMDINLGPDQVRSLLADDVRTIVFAVGLGRDWVELPLAFDLPEPQRAHLAPCRETYAQLMEEKLSPRP